MGGAGKGPGASEPGRERKHGIRPAELFPSPRRRFPRLDSWSALMAAGLASRRGFMLGESGLLSTCVHLLTEGTPGWVTVLQASDAGRVFYQRHAPGQVLHLDIFHADGEVDHRRAARYIRHAISAYRADLDGPGGNGPGRPRTGGLTADYIDVQTATGGGRVTGRLTYGRKITLRRAHRNHIHVTMLAGPRDVAAAFYVLAAGEAAALDEGLELRRVEGIIYDAGAGGGAPLSLDDYTDQTDSLLRPETPARAGGGPGRHGAGYGRGPRPDRHGAGRGSPRGYPGEGHFGHGGRVSPGFAGQSGFDGLRHPGRGSAAAGGGGSGPGSGPADSRGGGEGEGSASPATAALHWQAVNFAEQFESPDTALILLRALVTGGRQRDLERSMFSRGIEPERVGRVLKSMAREGWLSMRSGHARLTDWGRTLMTYIVANRREIRLALRKSLRRLTQRQLVENRPGLMPSPKADGRGTDRSRLAYRPPQGKPLGEIAWPETLLSAAGRYAGRAPGSAGSPLRLKPEDLRVYRRRRRRPVDICLLIDASASMSGERMRDAKTLVRHLLLTTRDKVAVIVFQERQVRISVPFTRNYSRVEAGLGSIRPFGLTPLAAGLEEAEAFIRASRPRNPLLLMITDGIPTVPLRGRNPLDDALEAARRWRSLPAGFSCIGLQPNERYLSDLVAAAGGSLYVVDELEAHTMMAIAAAEREKRAAMGPR